MLKDKTRLLRWRDLTGPDKLPTPPRQGSSSPPFGKNDSQMPECWHGGGGGVVVEASVWLARYLGIDIVLYFGSHFHLGAF